MSDYGIALKYFNEQKDFLDFRVKTGVEQNRKGNASIKLVDSEGNPVSGAKIILKQKNHEFKHGANIFMLDEFECEEKNQKYKEAFKDIFNIATVPFYWSDLEPEQGKPRFSVDSPKIYRRPAIDLCLNYCAENGIEPKCHCLNYDNFVPEWLKDADVGYHKKMLEKRFRELAERYADRIPSWEVTNETFNYNDQRIRYQTKFYKEDDFVEWSFRTADKYFPNNRLIINDYLVWLPRDFRENRSPYFMQIERLLKNGISHLDSVGMQFHSFYGKEYDEEQSYYRYNPERLYGILDTYAKLGKKLQITEMTIPAHSQETADEEVQAEIIKNLYSVFFSHPAMEAIIYWNLVDGYAAFAPMGDMTVGENVYYGGFMRFDLSEKPAYRVVKDLFSKQWHTETKTETDDGGMAHFRGFYGDYDMTIVKDGKEVTKVLNLSSKRNNENNFVI